MGKECELECVYFHALARIDDSLTTLNRKAREAAQKGMEFAGSAGSMCGTCVARKKIITALRDEKTKYCLKLSV